MENARRHGFIRWGLAGLLAGLALAGLWWAAGRAESPQPRQTADPTPADAGSPPGPDAHAGPDAAPTPQDAAEPADAVTPSTVPHKATDTSNLRILATPPELRVWANTRVRLQVENTGAVVYERFVWHFEDGSDPVAGLEVDHTFAESVRDRHVTVEAQRAGQPPVVVSRRLPVERLPIAPLDGDPDAAVPAEAALPAATGVRVVWAGGALSGAIAEVALAAAVRIKADALLLTDPTVAATLQLSAERTAPKLALGLWPVEPDTAATPALQWLRNPDDRITPLHKGGRDLGVWTLGDLALAVLDSRGETVAETDLKRLRDGLQAAGVYPTSLLLSARPLTLLRDGELIADRAYRIYEHALRQQVTAVVSASSGVWFDGRFGSAQVVAVGRAQAGECVRLSGNDACQAAGLTVLDASGRGKVTVHVLTGARFDHVASRAEAPAEVGKVRR